MKQEKRPRTSLEHLFTSHSEAPYMKDPLESRDAHITGYPNRLGESVPFRGTSVFGSHEVHETLSTQHISVQTGNDGLIVQIEQSVYVRHSKTIIVPKEEIMRHLTANPISPLPGLCSNFLWRR